ncbi:Lrp/AsnC ligand binding domain-containing protein [Streptomyces humi]
MTVAPSHLAATGAEASLHPEATFAASVTGTANLLVTTTCRTDADLYAYVTTRIGALPGVHQAEIVPVLHRLKQGGTRLHDNRLIPT